MHPIGWDPYRGYYTAADEALPPPYTESEMVYPPPPPPPPFATFPSARPDMDFPPGVFPFFGGFQPAPPGPPPPPPPPPQPPPPPPAQPAFLPGMTQGMTYLFPAEYTCLHVILNPVVPFESPDVEFQFTILRCPVNMTVLELLNQLGATKGPADKNGVTECLELGDGYWSKGLSIFKSDGAAKSTLAQVGWDQKRGTSHKPVWLVVSRGS
ncbi:MAG: hypothetical protein M1823_003304 [Watsoniomyces obsoletus]|nr:MAG: hypothetical protein M1823_003304 [Watsoniomyces obsoletus]